VKFGRKRKTKLTKSKEKRLRKMGIVRVRPNDNVTPIRKTRKKNG
jgi:hypothetical protein